MSDEHTVRPGDHAARVAFERGFRSLAPVWDEPRNHALRASRGTPHILGVGDQLVVPELNGREVTRPVDQHHTFKAKLRPLRVVVDLVHWNGTAVEDVPSEVLVDGRPPVKVDTSGPGRITVGVDALSDRIRIVLPDREVTARVGFLQPADTPAGVRQRLENLGYFPGDVDDARSLPFRSAVEEFQCDHRLAVDGKVGPATRAALVKAHGS